MMYMMMLVMLLSGMFYGVLKQIKAYRNRKAVEDNVDDFMLHIKA